METRPAPSGATFADYRLFVVSAVLTAAAALTHYVGSGSVLPFVISAVALAALAFVVGRSVDGLGDRLGAGMTGVVQSALGNLPELFVSIFALRAGLVEVVQSALVGSVLANVLLVLGLAFIAGGLRHGTQRFRADEARTVALLLLLSVAVLIIPSITARLHVAASAHEKTLSDLASVVLVVVYALSIVASLRSRRTEAPAEAGGEYLVNAWPVGLVVTALTLASIAAAFVSQWFVDALTPAIDTLHISQAFAGLVIVAIAGNAVENVVGIQLAAKNRSDYALSVILQSPVQISLGLFPALVLLSPVIGGAPLTLVLSPLLVVVLALAAVVTVVVVFDGESTWLEGVCLVGLYAVIAAAFWWG